MGHTRPTEWDEHYRQGKSFRTLSRAERNLLDAVRVAAFSGDPVVREPHLIRRWEWHDPADLPCLGAALFTPSAHVLESVWPGLLPGLPPVHRHPVAQPPRSDP
ncbi:hypothetical protein [Streptomyces blastmyceticus]|uniref:Uncharacterized protein n=1 Tax=Streptomyces blastmyceticus TaxID=68180 RepID=A0ABN0X2K0_9ACTN